MARSDLEGRRPSWGRLVAWAGRVSTPWITGGAVAVWLLSAAYMIRFGGSWHLDLRVYRGAGRSLFDGGSPFTQLFTASQLPFTYTPFALLILSPLALGALGPVESIWWMASAVCLVGAAVLMLISAFPMPAGRAWAVAGLLGGVTTLALEPVRSNFDYGQINVILMVMVVADLTRVRSRGRGVLVGLAAAIKLTPLIYLVYFALARAWRPLLKSAATFIVVTAVSWAVLPSGSDRYWLHEFYDAKRTGSLGIPSNQSWNGMLHRAPFHGGHLGTALWAALSLVTLAGSIVLTRRLVAGVRTAEAVMVLALTEVLVSPVSWTHHWSWLALAPIVAASVARVHRSVAVALMVLVGLAVFAPYLWIRHTVLADVASNSLVLGAAVVLVVWLVAEVRRPAARNDAVGLETSGEPRLGPVA